MNILLEFILFTFISSLEYVTVFIFMFTLFRHPLSAYKYHLAFACVLLSYVSFTMRTAGGSIEATAPLVQLTMTVILLWLLFQVQWFYAIFMCLATYICYSLVQNILFLSLVNLGLLDRENIVIYEISGLSILIPSVCLFLLISAVLRKRKWGFTFIPLDHQNRMKMRERNNIILLVLLITIIVIAGGSMYFWYRLDKTNSIMIILVLASPAILCWLLYQAFKKERS